MVYLQISFINKHALRTIAFNSCCDGSRHLLISGTSLSPSGTYKSQGPTTLITKLNMSPENHPPELCDWLRNFCHAKYFLSNLPLVSLTTSG